MAALFLGSAIAPAQQRPKAAAPETPAEAVAPTPPAAPADPLLQAATAAFNALPEAERKAMQDALVWTGDYNGGVDGEFGRLSYEAVRSWQRRQKAPPTGIIDEGQRKALVQAAERAKAAAKFAVVTDGIGLKIGIPRTAAPLTGKAGQGTKYHAEKDIFLLETMVVPASGPTLESMFDTARQTSDDRKVSYRLLRPDFFVVAGEDKGRRFYLRMAKGPNGLRGYRLSYPVARARDFDRLSIAIANSFEAFPALASAAVAPATPGTQVPLPPARPVEKVLTVVGSGLMIAPGAVLTASALLKACDDPQIGGAAVKATATDEGAGLVLLAAPGAKGRPWQRPPRSAAVEAAEDVVAPVATSPEASLAFAAGVATTAADGARWRLQAALQGGGVGAPIFDRQGALVGIVVEGRRAPFMVAGVVPASSYAVSSPGTIALFARDNRLTFASPAAVSDVAQSAGAVAAAVTPSVVTVTCLK